MRKVADYKIAKIEPSWECVSVLFNCECLLRVLYEDIPLRQNPFLVHWVEAIQRLEKDLPPGFEFKYYSDLMLKSHSRGIDVTIVRLHLLKFFLEEYNMGPRSRIFSPREIYGVHKFPAFHSGFDIGVYVRILEEEEIYDAHMEHTPERAKGKSTDGPTSSDSTHWTEGFLDLLSDPDLALYILTHSHVDLKGLEFITTLIEKHTLRESGEDEGNVVRDYVQHALRQIEQMGEPPPPPEPPTLPNGDNQHVDGAGSWLSHPSSSRAGTSASNSNSTASDPELFGVQHSQDAQIRAVKLLLLFIKNLIRKALVEPEKIYYEIQEICVRYVWIREVREFQSFIEKGEDGVGEVD